MSKTEQKGVANNVQTSDKSRENKMQTCTKEKRYTGGNGKTGTNTLSIERYNKIWTEYQRDQSIAAVARASRVSYQTARRYIQRGDPKRGLPALQDRLKEIQAEAVDLEKQTIASEIQNGLALTDKLTRYIEAQIGYELGRLAMNDAGEIIGQYVYGRDGKPKRDGNGNPMIAPLTKLTNDPIAAFNTIQRLRLTMLGEPEVARQEDEYAAMTESEIRDLIKTGRKPARLAGRVLHSKAASDG